MKNIISLLIGCFIGLGIVQLLTGDWLSWKLSNFYDKDNIPYEMFYLMRHPNEILKTPYEAIKIEYNGGYCLIKKPTYQEGDEIKLIKEVF